MQVIIVALALLFAGNLVDGSASEGTSTGSTAMAVAVSISVQSPLHIGSPMPIEIVFLNHGPSLMALRKPLWGPKFDFRVIDLRTGSVLHEEPNLQESIENPSQFADVRLAAGNQWKTVYDLSHFVQFPGPGLYSVQVLSPHIVYDPSISPLQPIAASSNVLTVTVTQ